jgi:cytochrome P450
MSEYARHTADRWHDGAVLDVHEEMMRLTRAIAGKTLFALEVGNDPGGVHDTIALSLKLYRYAVLPGGGVVEYLPLPLVRRAQRARARLNAWLAETIRRRREENGEPGDLLSMLLAARDDDGSAMSDQEVRDELVTLLLAGHETTAVALSWAWHLLSAHSAVQAKLHAELDAVLEGRPPTAADTAKLPYTRTVLAEAMRLYPPAWIVERCAVSEFTARGMRIPAGSLVYASPFLVQHDRRWYDDPERFDPDRWLAARDAKRPKFAYFPFGAGTRVCIGEQFAWMEGMLILATIGQRWRLEHDPTHKVAMEPLVTLRPKFGMRMRVSSRAPAGRTWPAA